MFNPFDEAAEGEAADLELIARIATGDRAALEQLVRRHQAWIFNIAVRMVCDPHDAEDVTQEVLIKVVTKLGSFAGRSQFRTWLYRIVSNHVLNMKNRGKETAGELSFGRLGAYLDALPDVDLSDGGAAPVDLPLLVRETRVRCTAGMLLCLDRRQRLVFTLGEIFGASDRVAGEILDLTAANFRQLLSRARRDLYNFMEQKCGLINSANPCRCAKKTKAMIDAGQVDPARLRFVPAHLKRVEDVADARWRKLEVLDERYTAIYRDHPFLDAPDQVVWLRQLVESDDFQRALGLDE